MNFLKRAILSVRKRLSKTLLMLLVFFVITSLILIGLAISNASEKAKLLAREKLGATVTLKMDTQKISSMIREQMRETGTMSKVDVKELDLNIVHELGKNEEVLGYNIKNKTSLIASEFEFIKDPDLEAQRQDLEKQKQDLLEQGKSLEDAQTELNNIQKELDHENRGRGGFSGRKMPSLEGFNFNLNFNLKNTNISAVSIYDLKYDEDFVNGNNELVEGEFITKEHEGQKVVVIEEEIATLNNLKVGNSIKVKDAEQTIETELKIIGIYKTKDKYGTNIERISSESQIPSNRIYIPLNVAVDKNIIENSNSIEIEYALKDPVLIESFINKGKLVKGIDFNYYIFDANNEAYEKMMGPIENVEYFAKMGLYGILIAGAIILSLIAMLAIKDRKYELGVLLSLGESKIKLIGQLVIETIIILILSFIIAFPVSSVTSNSVGNVLLNNELEVQTKETSERPRGFMRSDPMLNNVETIDKLDVSISNDVIFQLFGLGIMIAVISTIIPSISILRYNPKTILTKAD